MKRNRTRLAPTPSGYLHMGNVLSFAYTTAVALQTEAEILLRIDDMDRDRWNRKYVDDIFSTLTYLGIKWDTGPADTNDFELNFSQQYRLPFYQTMLEQLMDRNLIFACTCSRKQNAISGNPDSYPGTCLHKQLPLDTRGAAWRLKTAPSMVQVNTINGMEKHMLPATMQHFVVRKKDLMPAYQLTSLTDDLHFGVDMIVRGADLFPSTLAQLYLADLLGEEQFLQTVFYHHPLIADTNGIKLSKSAGATSVQYKIHEGATRTTLLNEIAAYAGVNYCNDWQMLCAQIAAKMR